MFYMQMASGLRHGGIPDILLFIRPAYRSLIQKKVEGEMQEVFLQVQ
jgi:hypothetical protein